VKKIAVGLIAVLGLVVLQPAYAEEKKSIVIIDTAVDTTLPQLSGKIVHEVCLMEELRCPNGKSFMEGQGSATLPATQAYSGGFAHGTIMSLIATNVNPDINIVFIRIYPMDKRGNIASSATNANSTVKQALDWVVNNKSRFNIVGASVSLGHRPVRSGENYCGVNRFDAGLRSSIVNLQNLGVASVFSTGNNYDKSRIDYPSCVSEAVAVSSVGPRGNTERYANDAKQVDFYALGQYNTSLGTVSGTSAATAAFTAYWAKNYKGNYQMTYDYIKSVAVTSDTSKVNSVVDVLK
jgi:hypothetical protein